MTTARGKGTVGRVFAVVVGAVLLTWPAVYNGYPLLYPDSISYLADGRPVAAAIFLHRLAGFTAQRSELYSVGILGFHWGAGLWGIVALNALLTAWVVWLTVRSVVPRRTGRRFVGIVLLLSGLTSASWYVSLVMPDILGALLYLAMYLLVFARETLGRWERVELGVLAVWAATAHATHLMLAGGLCVLLAALVAVRWRPVARRAHAVGVVSALMAVAAVCQIGLHAYLYGKATLNGNHAPYLMARIIADGPGRVYLERHCGQLDWAVCAHVAALPDNDDEFLWAPNGVWGGADAATQRRLLAEEMPLVRGTVREYPREQMARSWANFTQQMNDFGVNDFDDNAYMHAAILGLLPESRYPLSLESRSVVPTNFFTRVQRWVVIPAALLLLAALPSVIGRRRDRLLGLTVVIVPVLVANALVTAVLSSSDSRYQARVIWLVPLLAALVVIDWLGRAGQQESAA